MNNKKPIKMLKQQGYLQKIHFHIFTQILCTLLKMNLTNMIELTLTVIVTGQNIMLNISTLLQNLSGVEVFESLMKM